MPNFKRVRLPDGREILVSADTPVDEVTALLAAEQPLSPQRGSVPPHPRDSIRPDDGSFVDALKESGRLFGRVPAEHGLETATPLVPVADYLRRHGLLGELLAGLVPESRGDAMMSAASAALPAAGIARGPVRTGSGVLVRRWGSRLAPEGGQFVQQSGPGSRVSRALTGLTRRNLRERAYEVPEAALSRPRGVEAVKIGQRVVSPGHGAREIPTSVADFVDPDVPLSPVLVNALAKFARRRTGLPDEED